MWCFVHFEFQMCFATTACTFSTSQLPKVVRIATSKSGPNLVCFVHFDFEMRFAPQRRALFRHLNFQAWSEPEVFLVFSLANALRATTACKFSSHLARWPRTRHFSEPTAKTNAKPMMDNKNEIPKQQIKSLINKTDGAPPKTNANETVV